MRINSVKTIAAGNRRKQAFTLIEMIGVLAVIAILAAMLIPRVFSAIADAKINNAVVSTETIKTALADHYGKYGKFDAIYGTNGITVPSGATGYPAYDQNVLMPEGLIDKIFQTRLGTNWTVQVRACNTLGATPSTTDQSYSLDGYGTNNAAGQYVLEAVIFGVAEADAQAISARIDGAPTPSAQSLTQGQIGAADDTLGRVKYAKGTSGSPTAVYIYLTHR